MMIHFQGKDIKIDKKYILGATAILVFICLLIILMPKKKTLECYYYDNNSLTNDTTTYTATFKSNKLDTLVIKFERKFSEDYLHRKEELYDYYETRLKEFEDDGGYKYTIESGDDYIIHESTIDLNKIPDSTKNAVKFNNEWKYEDFKQDLITFGFVCK